MSEERWKLTGYFGERKRHGGVLVADALLECYVRHGIEDSIMLRGLEGFGSKHQLRTDNSLSLSEDLPVATIAIDSRARVEAVMDEASMLCGTGLVTLERVRLWAGERATNASDALPDYTKLTVYCARAARVAGRPAFVVICDVLRRHGVCGASAFLGVDGIAAGRRRRARFLARNLDVPVMVVAVGSGESIAAALGELRAMLTHPVITVQAVQINKRDGQLIEPPRSGMDGAGRPRSGYQRLTIYTSEARLHHGRPIHRSITRAFRGNGVRGATTVRGVWGFHGDHEPHGDRTFQYGRRVPVATTLVDEPDRIAESFELIDELTAEHGLVTCEHLWAIDDGNGADRLRE